MSRFPFIAAGLTIIAVVLLFCWSPSFKTKGT
jgi:hypothetical protein